MSCQKRSSRETKIIQKVIETFKNTLVTLPGWKVKQKKFPGIKRIQRKTNEKKKITHWSNIQLTVEPVETNRWEKKGSKLL